MSGYQGGMDDQEASESPEAGNPRQLPNGNIQNQLGQYMAQQDAEGDDEELDGDEGEMGEMDDEDDPE